MDGNQSRAPRNYVRDHQRLRDTLAVIDQEGWNGPAATALLDFVRRDLVRPLVNERGFGAMAARQAEATGWAAAWIELANPRLRTAASPWGVVWTRVRRAIIGEMLADRFGVGARTAWQRYSADGGAGPEAQVVSFDALVDIDDEPRTPDDDMEDDVAPIGAVVVDALVGVGWSPSVARDLVDAVVDRAADGKASRGDLSGSRKLGDELGIPRWQAHRVMLLMLGAANWPGLIERLATDGVRTLDDPAIAAAVVATVRPWSKSPAYEARAVARRASAATTLSRAS